MLRTTIILKTIMLALFLSVIVDVQAVSKEIDYTKLSLAQLKAKANYNDASAQFEIGMRYERGIGVTKNHANSLFWLKKAADNNHAEACGVLGDAYCDDGNSEQGVFYIRKGASLGDGRSYYCLFLAHSGATRYGLTENDRLAGEFLLKSADARFGDFFVIAVAYSLGSDGLSKNKEKAIYWGKKCCDKLYAEYLDTGKMPREGDGWPYLVKWLKKLGCDYDPALHVDEFKLWMSEKPEARSSNKPSHTANNAAAPKSSKVESYVYTESGSGQSQNTGQWTDAGPSMECVVEFFDDHIMVNGMYCKYLRTSGSWKVYDGLNMFGNTSYYYYYVDGNKNMKKVCDFSSAYGFDTFVYPMSRNGDPTPMGNNVDKGGYVNSSGANNKNGAVSTTQPARKFKCAYCNGTGRIERNDNAPASYGQTRANKKCNECGKIYDPTVFNHYHVQCGHCGGTGNSK